MRIWLLAMMLMLVTSCSVARSPGQQPDTVRAISLDPPVTLLDSERFHDYQHLLCDSGVNLVGISAGRLDWTYFRWDEHESSWAGVVRSSGRDPLAEALAELQRCPTVTHTSAIIDVFAPRYIEAHPEAAARTVDGVRIPHQVSSVELATGQFGEQLLEMIEYVAKTVPVQSITITELFYFREGYGPTDLESFRRFSGETDWPRLTTGGIDIESPQIGWWRSQLISTFIARAAAATHKHGKELFVDVRVPWDDLGDRGRKQGQDYEMLLQHADRLVLWVYLGLNDHSARYIQEIADAYQRYGRDRIIMSLGLWSRDGRGAVPATDLEVELREVARSQLPSVWVTPASMLSTEHWRVLQSAWAP